MRADSEVSDLFNFGEQNQGAMEALLQDLGNADSLIAMLGEGMSH